MPLLNYTTKIDVGKTASEIVAILAKHRATNIMMDYDGKGSIVGIKWRVDGEHGPLAFSLPVNVDAVKNVMIKQALRGYRNNNLLWAQAERVAWRILKDWIEAQMALLETEMVQLEEIFLPYMLSGDQTLYQLMVSNDFKVLPESPLRS